MVHIGVFGRYRERTPRAQPALMPPRGISTFFVGAAPSLGTSPNQESGFLLHHDDTADYHDAYHETK